MSGAVREGHDLFHKFGRRYIWGELRRGRWPRYIWGDSFGRFGCMLLGHDEYNSDGDTACRRCHKFTRFADAERKL